jgi:hypothetical protein
MAAGKANVKRCMSFLSFSSSLSKALSGVGMCACVYVTREA